MRASASGVSAIDLKHAIAQGSVALNTPSHEESVWKNLIRLGDYASAICFGLQNWHVRLYFGTWTVTTLQVR